MGKSSKRKGSGTGTAGNSPTSSTENKASTVQSKADPHAPPPPPPPGTFPPPPPPGTFPPPPPQQSHPRNEAGSNAIYFKIQTLPDGLHSFLDHDYISKQESYKCIDYYLILTHFNPATKSRPNHKKEKLIAVFMKDVFPLLEPYRSIPPSIPMQTDQTHVPKDFNPLSKKAKKQDLTDVIWAMKPSTVIPKAATNEGLLYLYKEHVDKDLQIPGDTEFIKIPSVVSRAQVKTLLMEELRLTLQDRAPHVFIHSIPMSHPVLVNLYIKFVLDEEVESGLLVRGFHYSLLRKEA